MSKLVVGFGELLLRLSTQSNKLLVQSDYLNMHYGGAEANVCVSLANFGIDAHYITKLPNNPLALGGILQLNKYGVHTSSILFGGERMGTYYLEQAAGARGAKVIYDRAYSSFSKLTPEEIDWNKILENKQVFFSTGICPALSEEAYKTSLLAIKKAKECGLTVVFDLNLREKLWQWGKTPQEIIPEFLPYVDVLIGNEMHLKQVLGITLVTDNEPEDWYYTKMANTIRETFTTIKTIAITSRRTYNATSTGFLAALNENNNTYISSRYKAENFVDRIGSGDAFTAGLIYGLTTFPDNPQKTIEFSTVAAFLKHSIVGDFNQVSPEEIEQLLLHKSSAHVSR